MIIHILSIIGLVFILGCVIYCTKVTLKELIKKDIKTELAVAAILIIGSLFLCSVIVYNVMMNINNLVS